MDTEIQADIQLWALARRRPKGPQVETQVASDAQLTATTSWAKLEKRWQAENAHLLAAGTLRLYRQVVSSLNEFDARLRLLMLTKERLAQYVGWLHAQGKRGSSV